jgi:hypothetical protein
MTCLVNRIGANMPPGRLYVSDPVIRWAAASKGVAAAILQA